MAKKSVLPGNPPLIWSNVEKAFANINSNFDELYLTIGGGSVVDLTDLESSLVPGSTNTYDLGSLSKAWGAVYASEYDSEGAEFNGLWAGNAQIKGIGTVIDLPLGSTVDGDLIIDPDKTFFKSVQVDDENRIVADEFVDTLNFLSGTAMQITVDSSAESITFTNTGVTRLTGGAGIGVSSATGNITVTNTGVLSISNSTNLNAVAPYTVGAAGRTAGTGIRIDTATGNPTLTNIGVIEVQGGFGITTNTDPVTGIATIQNNAPAQPAFGRIRISGDTFGVNDVVAEVTTDQLTLDPGYGINITNTPLTDTVAIELDQRIDIIGSVFSDGSTMLVDGTNGVIPAENLLGTADIDINGDTTGYHTGDVTGSVFGDDSTKLIDAVESKIVGPVENTAIATNTITGRSDLTMVGANGDTDGGRVIVVGGIGNGGDGGDITLAAGIGSAGAGGEVTIAGGIGSTDGGEVTITGGIGSAGEGGPVSINGGIGGTDGGDVTIYAGPAGLGYTNGVINIGTFNTSEVNISNATITGDLIGSVFGDDSSMIIDGVNGNVIYTATTPGDWDGDAPTTVGEAIDRLATLVKTLNGGTGA